MFAALDQGTVQHVVFGGVILATKATYDALINSQQGGDDISIQSLGTFFIEQMHSVEWMQFITLPISGVLPMRHRIHLCEVSAW